MIVDILLWYLGIHTSAPTWYFVVIAIRFFLEFLNYGIKMYKLGAK